MIKNSIKPDGEWVPVYQEIGGRILPADVYSNQKLLIKANTYAVISDKADEGIILTNGTVQNVYKVC